MITRSAPYSQRVIVPDKPVEEVYKTVSEWLRFNNCSITRQTPPTDIEAEYSADIPAIHAGIKDEQPKTINVRLSSFGTSALLYVTITQQITRMGTRGYVYWGIKLQELYEELDVNETVYSELLPERILDENIATKTKIVAAILLFSVLVVGYLWGQIELIAMYITVIMIPALLLSVWDLQAHRELVQQTRKTRQSRMKR